MSIKSAMPSNHLILCHPFFLLSSIFPASGSFPVKQLFASGGQSIGASASASVLPMNIHGWFPLGLTGLISLCHTANSIYTLLFCIYIILLNSHISLRRHKIFRFILQVRLCEHKYTLAKYTCSCSQEPPFPYLCCQKKKKGKKERNDLSQCPTEQMHKWTHMNMMWHKIIAYICRRKE